MGDILGEIPSNRPRLDGTEHRYIDEAIATGKLSGIERIAEITAERRAIRAAYHEQFADLEEAGVLRRPIVPDGCKHSGHLHYLPLGASPGGRRFGRQPEPIEVAESISGRLVRLPLWCGLGEQELGHIVRVTRRELTSAPRPRRSRTAAVSVAAGR